MNALAPQIPTIYLLAIGVANEVATLKLLDNIPRWSLGYLIGWIIGVVIILQSGVIDWSGLIVYFVVPVLVFIYRIYEILSG